jgi:hypothetical protein
LSQCISAAFSISFTCPVIIKINDIDFVAQKP